MKLNLVMSDMIVNFEADSTYGDELAVLDKIKALLEDIREFDGVFLSIESMSDDESETEESDSDEAWPFPVAEEEDADEVETDGTVQQ